MSQYPKRLILNGFGMTVVGHVSAGLWRHPSDRASRYTTLSYWTDLARLLESGGFDALFLADALGHLDVTYKLWEGSWEDDAVVRTVIFQEFITSVTAVTGPDDASARRKYEDYLSYTSVEAALALFSAWTGADWSRYDLDHPLEYIETDAGRSALATLTGIDADRRWTLGDVAEYIGVGGIHPKIVGGPQTVADRLESFADDHPGAAFRRLGVPA